MTPSPAPPKENIFKHAAIAFVMALVGYVCFFAFDAHLRSHKGPWIVRFEATTNGEPLLFIRQPWDKIATYVLLQGEKATNTPGEVRFTDMHHIETPFGRVRFHDLTYLPGTVVLDVYGHEIQMMPRTLTLDLKEVGWANGATNILTPTNKIPGLKDRDTRGRR
jgi:hypothetical protein